MSSLANLAFKLFDAIDKRLENIEVHLGRLADAKDDRETAKELSASVDAKADALKKALPPGTP